MADGNAPGEADELPPLRPIRRLRVLLNYRFGLISVAALVLTLILTLALSPLLDGGAFKAWQSGVGVWALGAVTFLLLATGGIPEPMIRSDDAALVKPARWLPDYNGLHRIGLALAFLQMLAASLGGAVPIRLPTDMLVQVTGATTGWILLRQALILMSLGIGKAPLVGRFLRVAYPFSSAGSTFGMKHGRA